jgi:spermidine/putrescine-binding protein
VLFWCGVLVSLWSCSLREAANSKGPTPKKVLIYNNVNLTDFALLQEFQKLTGIEPIVTEYKSADEALAKLQENPDSFDLIIDFLIQPGKGCGR